MGMIKVPEKSIAFFKDNFQEIIDSGELAEGKWNMKVAVLAMNYSSTKNALTTNSNGSGIFTILYLLKQLRGYKNFFIQSNTMYGVQTMSMTTGLNLSGFVECSIDYLMPTYEDFKKFVKTLDNPSENVFLITHIGGWVNPDIEQIANLCNELGIALVEDCAHSYGSTLRGRHTGSFGVAGVYSLYATKAITAGEGGIIVTNDEELSHYAARFVIYDRFQQELNSGVNLRMSEISALFAYSILQYSEDIISQKYSIANRYIEVCEEKSINFINPSSAGQRSNLYKFILISKNEAERKRISKIKTRTSSVYDYALGKDSKLVSKNHVCLPIWYKLDNSEIERVLKEISGI